MARTEERRPTSKDDNRWRKQGKGPHDDLEVRVAYALVHIPTLLRFLADITLTAFWITAEEGGWRLTIKGIRRKKPVVAYLHVEAFRDLMGAAATSADSNTLRWWPDKHPIRI